MVVAQGGEHGCLVSPGEHGCGTGGEYGCGAREEHGCYTKGNKVVACTHGLRLHVQYRSKLTSQFVFIL